MRRTFFAFVFSIVLVTVGCQSGPDAASSGSEGTAAVNTEEEKTIYTLGLIMARQLKGLDLKPNELAIVQRGLVDAVAGKPLVDIDTYGPKVNEFASARMTANAAAGSVAEKEKGKAYAEKAAKEPGAQLTPSGLVYRELTAGKGASPKVSDTIRIHYRGTFLDGKEFDSSYKRNEPINFPLGNLIPCWQEALPKMKIGGKAQLVCPSDIAYGDSGRGDIPGGATLLFEIELLGIQ